MDFGPPVNQNRYGKITMFTGKIIHNTINGPFSITM
jgi:hypothetical protein